MVDLNAPPELFRVPTPIIRGPYVDTEKVVPVEEIKLVKSKAQNTFENAYDLEKE